MSKGHHEGRTLRKRAPGATLDASTLGITRLKSDQPGFGFLPVPPLQDAYLLWVHLRALSEARIFHDTRLVGTAPMRVHSVHLAHLDCKPRLELLDPFDCILFTIPRTALLDGRPAGNAHAVESLRCPAAGTVDATLGHLAACLLPALEQREHGCRLFIETVTHALCAHVLHVYGDRSLWLTGSLKGGLALWQEQRVKDLIEANLDCELSLSTLAAECAMSVGHFGHAFKQSVGLSPYQYLIGRRLERAKQLMAGTQSSLLDIALSSGFGTQNHFNRRFHKANGMTPGSWRRSRRDAFAMDSGVTHIAHPFRNGAVAAA